MSNANKKRAASLVGEICLYGTTLVGAGWLARGKGTGLVGNGEPVAGRAFTDAVWQAADVLRAAHLEGVVAIYAAGGEFYALADLTNVPTFGDLQWKAAGHAVVISAEQIAAVAR